jgi:hypothetical protein
MIPGYGVRLCGLEVLGASLLAGLDTPEESINTKDTATGSGFQGSRYSIALDLN